MNPVVAQWMRNAEQRIEAAVKETVTELARESVTLLRSEFESNRRKTRQSAKWRRTGPMAAEAGLFFSVRYRNRQTFTHQRFRESWRSTIRPKLVSRLFKKLNMKLAQKG